MLVFKYKALQEDGKLVEGQLEAGARAEALRQMDAKGLRAISLVEQSGKTKTTALAASAGTRFRFGWLPAGLFSVSLLLPAVNLDPWLSESQLPTACRR